MRWAIHLLCLLFPDAQVVVRFEEGPLMSFSGINPLLPSFCNSLLTCTNSPVEIIIVCLLIAYCCGGIIHHRLCCVELLSVCGQVLVVEHRITENDK